MYVCITLSCVSTGKPLSKKSSNENHLTVGPSKQTVGHLVAIGVT